MYTSDEAAKRKMLVRIVHRLAALSFRPLLRRHHHADHLKTLVPANPPPQLISPR